MVKIINGKRYNTETATRLFENGTGSTANFSDWYEIFYVTKNGNFFKEYWGGAMTEYAETFNNGRSRSEGRGIIPMEKEEVLKELTSDSYDVNEDEIEKFLNIEDA